MKNIKVAAEIKRISTVVTAPFLAKKRVSKPGRYGPIEKEKMVIVDASDFCGIWLETKFILKFLAVLKQTKVKDISVSLEPHRTLRITFGRAVYYLKGLTNE